MDENTKALMGIHSELTDLNENIKALIKAVKEPHYETCDGALSVYLTK